MNTQAGRTRNVQRPMAALAAGIGRTAWQRTTLYGHVAADTPRPQVMRYEHGRSTVSAHIGRETEAATP